MHTRYVQDQLRSAELNAKEQEMMVQMLKNTNSDLRGGKGKGRKGLLPDVHSPSRGGMDGAVVGGTRLSGSDGKYRA